MYNPQIQRELAQVGQQGLGGPPSGSGGAGGGAGGGNGYGGFGNFGHAPGTQAGQSLGQTFSDLAPVGLAAGSLYLLSSPFNWQPFGGGEVPGKIPIPLLGNFLSFLGIGGGSDQPATPRRRSTNWDIVAVRQDLTPNQQSMVYPSIDAAVRAAQAPAVNRFRTNRGREAYGYVLASGKGFTYTGPFDAPGRFGGNIDVPPEFVASYHTHSESGMITQDTDDIDFLNKYQKPLYILTVPPGDQPAANGGIFRYMPGKPEEPYMLP